MLSSHGWWPSRSWPREMIRKQDALHTPMLRWKGVFVAIHISHIRESTLTKDPNRTKVLRREKLGLSYFCDHGRAIPMHCLLCISYSSPRGMTANIHREDEKMDVYCKAIVLNTNYNMFVQFALIANYCLSLDLIMTLYRHG